MTTVLKAGGSSVASEEKIQRILEQAHELDDLIVLIVSAQGKTTDRIVKAIESAKNGGPIPEPEEIFQEFEGLGIGNKDFRVTGIRDSVYGEFETLREQGSDKVKALEAYQKIFDQYPLSTKLTVAKKEYAQTANL